MKNMKNMKYKKFIIHGMAYGAIAGTIYFYMKKLFEDPLEKYYDKVREIKK